MILLHFNDGHMNVPIYTLSAHNQTSASSWQTSRITHELTYGGGMDMQAWITVAARYRCYATNVLGRSFDNSRKFDSAGVSPLSMHMMNCHWYTQKVKWMITSWISNFHLSSTRIRILTTSRIKDQARTQIWIQSPQHRKRYQPVSWKNLLPS